MKPHIARNLSLAPSSPTACAPKFPVGYVGPFPAAGRAYLQALFTSTALLAAAYNTETGMALRPRYMPRTHLAYVLPDSTVVLLAILTQATPQNKIRA